MDEVARVEYFYRKKIMDISEEDLIKFLDMKTRGLNNMRTITPVGYKRYLEAFLRARSAVGITEGRNLLELKLKQMRGIAAQRLPRQAVPIPREHIRAIINEPAIDMETRLALFLTWATASRVSDVGHLKPWQLTFQSGSNRIGLAFMQTKATMTNPNRLALYPVIEVPSRLKEELERLQSGRGGCSLLFPRLNAAAVRQLLKEHFPGKGYTAHSLRRGAVEVMVSEVQRHPELLTALSMALKHRTIEPVSGTTVRYASVPARHVLYQATGAVELLASLQH